ncbi:T9SS type A sorting domain-containing protein [Ferruginibacter lapsinanis]|uniref:T9SS type A sorting domain-containing protein n=1 Tax=Ferruginibacter lapsinanis TaxID=563172 RepID=UPI001E4F9F56|nr:T9SS type A sorting domain-containing protein [Ferruginibacter lapsinanis]UEG49208.1 T9SS type A sorting domain-containing protein [Ferruginibacter lapsinanis]
MNKLLTFLVLLLISLNGYCIPKLNSWPTAAATIYLDFDGYYVDNPVWNNAVPFNCAPSPMTDAEITEIFNRVSEDYRPFNINITTDSTVYLAAPLTQRIRVVVTPTSSWYPGVGGVTYKNSFTWGDDTPCFVFCDKLGPNSPKMVAECCSHESGHSLGLDHQSSYDNSCNRTAVYNQGQGTGEIGWAPIMGNSYYRNMSSWNNGPTPLSCSLKQDNLSIITSSNGFSYRTDDHSDDINVSPTLLDPININADGLISTSTDKDAFKFKIAKNANFHLEAAPFSVGPDNNGADVDLRVQLYDASKKLIGTFDQPTILSVTIDTVLNSGDYYLVVNGSDNANATQYNSLGSYRLRGATSVLLPIRSIVLSGKKDNNKHDLNWNIIADEPLRSVTIEASIDGVTFKPVHSFPVAEKSYSYTPSANSNNIYYRLTATSTTGETVFSNVIALKNSEVTSKAFTVSTFVYNDITVRGLAKFQYRLNDMSGKVIMTGNGTEGVNDINVNGLSKGVYILQLMSNDQRQVERIIKQ